MNTYLCNILIVEDEYINSEYLKHVLITLGFETIHCVTNANAALDVVSKNSIDFVFMDINIDGAIDGIDCAKLLNQKYQLPIIYTTAYTDSTTISEASNTNIYGYLIKPFDAKDVEIICQIVLKNGFKNKSKDQDNSVVSICENYKYNLQTKTLTIDNHVIKLSKNELKLLDILCKNINQCVHYDLIKDYVWENKKVADSTMRDTISRLRRKAVSLQIETLSSLGYCLKKF